MSLLEREPVDDAGPARPVLDILSQIKDGYGELRPAERRVADVVLADVAFAVDASNALIAQRAEVSEPTVTRFCRAIGCTGVRDFKLKLAQSVIVGQLYLSANRGAPQPPQDPSPLWDVVFGEAHKALEAVQRQVDPKDVVAAADLIASARMVVVFGLGGSSAALAEETRNRLFRYGVVVSAHSDPYDMRMVASTLHPDDVALAISATGRTQEVVQAVELARHYRARAICITAPDSDLARICDVRLTVDVPEYPDLMKPTASRFAFLALVDLVSAATGYRIGAGAAETLRRVKYNVVAHRKGRELEPLGD